MRTKAKAALLRLVTASISAISLFSGTFMSTGAAEHTAGEIEGLTGGIVSFKLEQSGAGSVQDWINGALTEGAGSNSEWYVITLSQSGDYDFSSYAAALESYTESSTAASATTRQKYALALIAAGSDSDYIAQAAGDSAGQLGIMSWDYALHLENNGVSTGYTADELVSSIISMQLPDGGWAVIGEYGDVDVTAMTVSALAPLYPYSIDVQYAVDSAVELLSAKQQPSGGFKSMGVENPESTAQVIVALSALGIDCQYDERFIKDGNSPIDGLLTFYEPDGSFAHTLGGGYNESATVQAYYSLTAYERLLNGQGPFLVLDRQYSPAEPPTEPDIPEQPASQSASQAQPSQGSSGNSSDQGNTDVQGNTPDTPGNGAAISGTSAVTGTQAVRTSVTAAAAASPQTGTTTAPGTAAAEGTEKTSVSTASSSVAMSSTYTGSSAVTAAIPQTTGENSDKVNGGYKLWVTVIIWAAAAVLSLLLAALGKRNWKNFLAVALAAALATAIVLLTDIKKPEEYYGSAVVKENSVGTVTMTIRCDTIVQYADESEYIPEDGEIFGTTAFEFAEGDTVFTILTDAAREYGIQVDSRGAYGMDYVAGINYLYELQYGELSGWIYHVNGKAPSVGCSEYTLSDGDVIEWLYTVEVGNDLLPPEETYPAEWRAGE
ncbi:MAG: DUF4430 domain-containing protein [Ruminococcus sp.]|nr:DUF4430 domain-containing protein [Ruminococcus sp.]